MDAGSSGSSIGSGSGSSSGLHGRQENVLLIESISEIKRKLSTGKHILKPNENRRLKSTVGEVSRRSCEKH